MTLVRQPLQAALIARADIESSSDTGGGYNVGWMTAGEWINYFVSVVQGGTNQLTARVAAAGPSGAFHVEFGSVNKTGSLVNPNIGGWQNWTDVTATIALNIGPQTMGLVADGNGPGGGPVFDRSGAARVVVPNRRQRRRGRPEDHYLATFNAPANTPYRVWLRTREPTTRNSTKSAWAQFSERPSAALRRTGSARPEGCSSTSSPASTRRCRLGLTERCLLARDTGEVRFSTAGPHTIRVHVREDGVQLDQIILSPGTYLNTRPGSLANDTTIIPRP